MKVNGFSAIGNNIPNIQKTEQKYIFPEKSQVKTPGQQSDKVSVVKKIKKDSDLKMLLSNDELDYLTKLFPDKIENNIQADVYNLNRKKVASTKIGSVVDVKS